MTIPEEVFVAALAWSPTVIAPKHCQCHRIRVRIMELAEESFTVRPRLPGKLRQSSQPCTLGPGKTSQKHRVSSPAGVHAALLVPMQGACTKDWNRLRRDRLTCACHDGPAIRGHGLVEHAPGVAREGGQLVHGGVLPDYDLIVLEAVGRNYLVGVLAPQQVAHLAACART